MPAEFLADDPWVGTVDRPPPDGLDDGPDALGRCHQRLLARDERHRLGVFHTPLDVARPLVELALDELGRTPRRVLDPAVGGGALLVAVADALVARGASPGPVASSLHGGDVDPIAARVADWTLRRWAWRHGLGWGAGGRIEVRDALDGTDRGAVDLLVTNPPFGGRLRRPDASSTSAGDEARRRFGDALGPYADVAAAFVLAADDVLDDDGVAALVAPTSLLAARDAERMRTKVSRTRRLAAVWIDPPRFDGVTIAPLGLVLGPPGPATTVRLGGERSSVPVPGARWSQAASVVPDPGELTAAGSVGDVADVLAPFRDEYYGLVPAVADGGNGSPLLTSGLIDPGVHHWGRRPARFARRRFDRPTVDAELADGAGRRWIDRQRAPKVLVASQTSAVEAVADPDGSLVGVTPVIAVVPRELDVFELLAVLLSPIATALIRRGGAGSGLNPSAVRVTGPSIAALPLPARHEPWTAATAELAAAHAVGTMERALPVARRLMLSAYGLDPDGEVARWAEALFER
ncbi:MAG: N-6 DNA methylase [Actinomycetota bacterium]